LDVAFLLAESKRIADNNEADMSKTMIQASDLKDQLENQGTACNDPTKAWTFLFFCSLARLKLTRKAANNLSKDLLEKIKSTSNLAWT